MAIENTLVTDSNGKNLIISADDETLELILNDVMASPEAMKALYESRKLIAKALRDGDVSSPPHLIEIYKPIYDIMNNYGKYYSSTIGKEIIDFLSNKCS